MQHGSDVNTGVGSADVAWLGRLVTKVENSIDKLTDKIDQLKGSQEAMRQAIAVDQDKMREAFRLQVQSVDDRVDHLERELVRLRLIASATIAVAMVIIAGLGSIAVPRMFGNQPHSGNVQQVK